MNKKYLNPEFEKLPLKKMFVISIAVSSSLIILGLVSQIFLPPQIPLFYGLPQTEHQLAPSILILLPPIVSITITTVNALVATKVNDVFLKKILAFSSISICLLIAITTIKIIFLISSF